MLSQKNRCYTCRSENRLSEETIEWKMFDGRPVKIDIHKCSECIKFTKELLGFKTDDWIEKAVKKLEESEKQTTLANKEVKT